MSSTRGKKSDLIPQPTILDFSDILPVQPRHAHALRSSVIYHTRLAQMRSLERAAGRAQIPDDAFENATAQDVIADIERRMSFALQQTGERPLFPPANLNISQREFNRQLHETEQRQALLASRAYTTPLVTLRNIRTANEIRNRQRETARMAGGLLGPYTMRDCRSVSVFIAKHHSLLRAGSLRPDQIDDKAYVFCISYRHKEFDTRHFDKDRMTELEYRNWFGTTRALLAHGRPVFFWQDQQAKGVRTDGDMDWISNGILPYMMCPVIILTSKHGTQSDGQRLWMSVEKTLARMNSGYILVGSAADHDTMRPALTDITEAERRLASMVVHGLFEGKETYHEDDRLKMIRWAVSHLVPLCPESLSTFEDITKEASVKTEELSALCEQATLHVPRREGLTIKIHRRCGLGHTSWADLISVFETQRGDVPGGISVRGARTNRIFDGDYNLIKAGNYVYYVRFLCQDGQDVLLTGKVQMQEHDNDMSTGRVMSGKKIFSTQFSAALKRFASRLVYLLQCGDVMAVAETYVNGRKELIETATKRIVLAAWGISGDVVYLLSGENVTWG